MRSDLNNLHQIGIAMANYATGAGGSLPTGRLGKSGPSWRLSMTPFLLSQNVERFYDFDKAWDAAENHKVTGQSVSVMTSPFRQKRVDENGKGFADYGMISGPGTANPPEGPVTLDFILEHDGLGTTLLVGECSGLQIIWTEPRDPDVSREQMGFARVTSHQPTSDRLLSSYGSYGAVVLFADGSAKLLASTIDPKLLSALCSVNGDEAIHPTDWQR